MPSIERPILRRRMLVEVEYFSDRVMYTIFKPDKRKKNSYKKWQRDGLGVSFKFPTSLQMADARYAVGMAMVKNDVSCGLIESIVGTVEYDLRCIEISRRLQQPIHKFSR